MIFKVKFCCRLGYWTECSHNWKGSRPGGSTCFTWLVLPHHPPSHCSACRSLVGYCSLVTYQGIPHQVRTLFGPSQYVCLLSFLASSSSATPLVLMFPKSHHQALIFSLLSLILTTIYMLRNSTSVTLARKTFLKLYIYLLGSLTHIFPKYTQF